MAEEQSDSTVPDATVRAPVAVLVGILIILLAAALATLALGETTQTIVSAYVLFALLASVVTFGILGASGSVRTKRWQFSGSAAIFIVVLSVLLPFVEPPNKLYGRVYRADDKTVGVGGAKVAFELDGITYAESAEDGSFSFRLAGRDLGRSATLWATPPKASRLAPSAQIVLLLKASPEKAQIPLEPLKDIASALNEDPRGTTLPAASRPIPTLEKPVAVASAPSVQAGNGIKRFSFIYQFDPPGRRDWSRLAGNTWAEKWESGEVELFDVVTEGSVDVCAGTIVRNRNHPTFEVFIPHKGCDIMWLQFRHEKGEWNFLGEMIDIQ